MPDVDSPIALLLLLGSLALISACLLLGCLLAINSLAMILPACFTCLLFGTLGGCLILFVERLPIGDACFMRFKLALTEFELEY
jgi:hypothetical protein